MSERDDIVTSTRRIRARELAAWAHDYASRNPAKLRGAGAWLDTEYSTAAVLERRERAGREDRSADIPASAYQLCPSPEMEKETLLVIRLNSAIMDLRHEPPDMTSAALNDPLPWAYRVVLLVCLATDRDAGTYTAGLTEIGQLPWVSDTACRCWGSLDELLEGRDPILRLLEEARHLIVRADHKARAMANPLLQDVVRQRPKTIQRLFDAIIRLECATWYLLDTAEDPVYAGGEKYSEDDLELSGIYLDWSVAADAALTAANEAIAAAEPTRPRLDEAWLAELRQMLRDFISLLHPVNVGMDGRALRQGRVAFAPVRERLGIVSSKRLYLMDVVAASVEPQAFCPPTAPPATKGDAQAAQAQPDPVAPASAEKAVFRREGEFWRVEFKGSAKLLKHRKGMTDIAALLQQPDPATPIKAVDLMGLARTSGDSVPDQDALADNPAIKDYVEELNDLNARRDAAAEVNDDEQLADLESDIQRVAEHIRAVTGLGGRNRSFDSGNAAEKAQKAVAKRINDVIDVLQNLDSGIPSLAKHLDNSIRTERAAFAYRPGKPVPNWELF